MSTFRFTVGPWNVHEGNETFGLLVQRNTTDAASAYLAKSTFTIQDDDNPATSYVITPGTTTVNEEASTVSFTVARTGTLPAETVYSL